MAALATRIAAWPRVRIAFAKELLKRSEDGDFDTWLEAEARFDAACYCSAEVRARPRAFVEERRRRRLGYG